MIMTITNKIMKKIIRQKYEESLVVWGYGKDNNNNDCHLI
jgi:hypothetical protein